MKKLLLIALLFLAPKVGLAQGVVTTQPSATTTQSTSGTIASTNTFQSVFPAVVGTPGGATPLRRGCSITFNRGGGPLYVFFGPIAQATTPTSIPLVTPTNITFGCVTFSGDAIPQDQISVTGNAGDGFGATQQ